MPRDPELAALRRRTVIDLVKKHQKPGTGSNLVSLKSYYRTLIDGFADPFETVVLTLLERSGFGDLSTLPRLLAVATEDELTRARTLVATKAPTLLDDLESLIASGRLEFQDPFEESSR
jgi:hypothetical protein